MKSSSFFFLWREVIDQIQFHMNNFTLSSWFSSVLKYLCTIIVQNSINGTEDSQRQLCAVLPRPPLGLFLALLQQSRSKAWEFLYWSKQKPTYNLYGFFDPLKFKPKACIFPRSYQNFGSLQLLIIICLCSSCICPVVRVLKYCTEFKDIV